MERIRAAKAVWFLLYTVMLLALLLLTGRSLGQTDAPTSHTIFITVLEVKGGTTADKLAPPGINPKDISKGYEFKPPGEADKNNPKRWEVSSYLFSPGFVTVRQGDRVNLTVFVVNGDEHEVWIAAPDGQRVVAAAKWNRGREYTVQFVAEKTGSYQLVCSAHAPTMAATFLALPR
jgi:plastocyanin